MTTTVAVAGNHDNFTWEYVQRIVRNFIRKGDTLFYLKDDKVGVWAAASLQDKGVGSVIVPDSKALEETEVLIAFWDGKDPRVFSAIRRAEIKDIRRFVIVKRIKPHNHQSSSPEAVGMPAGKD